MQFNMHQVMQFKTIVPVQSKVEQQHQLYQPKDLVLDVTMK